MNKILQNDLQHLGRLMALAQQQGLDFLDTINLRPTTGIATAPAGGPLNEAGLGGEDALRLFNSQFEPLTVASTGPRYWGYVTGGATPAALMGDVLAGCYDQNSFSVKGQGDVSAQLELDTVRLLLELLGLPAEFFGGFVTGATMSNFTCLAAARQWAGREMGVDVAREGVPPGIRLLAALPHSSVIKSMAMLGIGSRQLQTVRTAAPDRECMDLEDLERQIGALNGAPAIVSASAGTVNTADYDDLQGLAALKKRYRFWLHVDGAFGAFAACSPQHKSLLQGWHMADSIAVDCHKWLNVPYDSAFFLVRKEHERLQTDTFRHSDAPYLRNLADNFSYLNVLPESSRRLRALPVWFTLRAYGKAGYRDIVENSVRMAALLGAYIAQSGWLQLLAPVRLNNVVFTLNQASGPEEVNGLLTALNSGGKVFMTPTTYGGRRGIRASFVNWRTGEEDIAIAIAELEKLKPAGDAPKQH